MKQLITAMFLLALVACGQSGHHAHDINGRKINFGEYKGKWVYINYWASWCKPCYEEIPALNQFYQAHKGKDAVVLGVSYDQASGDKLRALVAKMGIQFPTLTSDPKQVLGLGDVPGLPATFVFNPDGKLSEGLFGAQTLVALEKAMKQGS